MFGRLSSAVLATSLLLLPAVQAYIPAAAVNQTTGLVRSDQSQLDFVWVRGTYSSSVSLQLTAAANQSDFFPSYWANGGVDRGALVHFSEDMVKNNDTSDTPWIAFISCDSNSTAMSTEDDIFTLARDRGAMAALLYSNKSEGCQIEQEYLANFEQVLDVFTTHNRDDAIVIESQFEQHCDPAFQNFAPSLLNTSYQSVTSLLNGTYPTSNTYLVAILTAFNATATVPVLKPTSSATTPASPGGGGGSKPATSLAMIILYAITGVITVLFCVVIISGAVRALRHPERYGPRRGRPQPGTYPYNFDDPQYGGPDGTEGDVVIQTRSAGLAKAIVDTFPIIKFVSKNKRDSGGGGLAGAGGGPPKKLASETWEMPPVTEGDAHDQEHDQLNQRRSSHSHSRHPSSSSSSSRPLSSHGPRRGSKDDRSSYHSTYQSPIPSASPSRHALADTAEDDEAEFVVPVLRSGLAAGKANKARRSVVEDDRSMGKAGDAEDDLREHEGESCAICLLEFEEGDDLRVLPCEGQHQFHQECIDNWLLDISGNCPLCRKDFSLAPATASTSSLPLTADPPASAVAAGNPLAARVTRYLANVRSNRRERRFSGNAPMQQASGLSSMLAGTPMH